MQKRLQPLSEPQQSNEQPCSLNSLFHQDDTHREIVTVRVTWAFMSNAVNKQCCAVKTVETHKTSSENLLQSLFSTLDPLPTRYITVCSDRLKVLAQLKKLFFSFLFTHCNHQRRTFHS